MGRVLVSVSNRQRPTRRRLMRGAVVALALTNGGGIWSGRAAFGQEAPTTLFSIEDVLTVATARGAALSPDGRWLIVSTANLRDRLGVDNSRYGDPSYVGPSVAKLAIVDTRSGETRPVFDDKRQVRALRWSPDARWLAMMELDGDWWQPILWERSSGGVRAIELPEGVELAENLTFYWKPDSSGLVFAGRPEKWRAEGRAKFVELTEGPVVVLSSENDFLAWEEMRRFPFERSLFAYELAGGAVHELPVSGLLRSYRMAEDGSFLIVDEDITEKTDYERIFGTQSSVHYVPLYGGERYTVVESTAGMRLSWSGDLSHYAYTKEGKIFFSSVDGEPLEIEPVIDPEEIPERPERDEEAADTGARRGEDDASERGDRFSITRVSHTGDRMILSNRYGLWLMDTDSGDADLLVDIDPEDDEAPRYSVAAWSRDGGQFFFTYASRTEWERGLLRFDVGMDEMVELVKDDRLYSGVTLSEDGNTLVLSIAEANRPSEVFVADTSFARIRRLTDSNPRLRDKKLSDPRLIKYLDVDGNELNGVLYPPVDWEPGTPVPTLFHIYETYFDPRFSATNNLLNAQGYAVVQPSVNLEIGYPGESWMKGVTSAANKLIDMGIADPEKLGVYGTSYGGYATNLLIAQTKRFKAAINISGKVNMVSFYTDSPRLGVRNIHAPENSQDRIGATLWEQPQKYIAHSAVMYADRIETPLLLMTGEQDYNVPARQAMEMYYALRRLGQPVEWVNYINGGHGMPRFSEEDVIDYHRRILDWYDTYLMPERAGELTNQGHQ